MLPPWRRWPGTEPDWSGWRQGRSEHWLLRDWLPFWRALDAPARERFLAEHPPPDEAWRDALRRWG